VGRWHHSVVRGRRAEASVFGWRRAAIDRGSQLVAGWRHVEGHRGAWRKHELATRARQVGARWDKRWPAVAHGRSTGIGGRERLGGSRRRSCCRGRRCLNINGLLQAKNVEKTEIRLFRFLKSLFVRPMANEKMCFKETISQT